MVNFVDLHLHSTYSHGDGYGTLSQIIERAKSLDRKAIALTDHGSVSGYVQLNKECEKSNIKPIFGYEAYMVDSLSTMFESKERHKNHITLLAKNNQGYANILKLASKAYLEGFYYRPTIDTEMLFNHFSGLIVLSGCWTGKMQSLLNDKNKESVISWAKKYKDVFGDNFYLETQHYDLFTNTYIPISKLSKILNIPMVLTCDVHYLTSEQAEIQEMLHAARDIRTFDSTKIIQNAHQWQSDDLLEYMNRYFPNISWQPIMEKTAEIADSIDVKMPFGGAPRFGVLDAAALLRQKAYEGLQKHGKDNTIYRDRLEHELQIVQKKDFSDYFLITQDIVNWAKEHYILVGPGRGSSGGSLLCYVLYINEIDPIVHNLMFERFIDIDRYDYPDIDMDYEREKRSEVKKYVSTKYGEDKVTNIATFSTYSGKNSLDSVGKMFHVPASEVATVKKYLVERSEADMRSGLTIEDTFEMSDETKEVARKYPDLLKAKWLEGQYKNFGRHAAGIVISTVPLDEIMAIYTSTSGDRLASFDMGDLETIKLLKFDVLGLAELGVIHDAAKLANVPFADIYKIEHTDEKTLEGFRNLDTIGIFQYDGDSTKSILRQMKNINFKELADCIALSKPGPAHSGASTFYLDAMRGDKATGFLWNPILKAITEDTYGQILYQEQLMQVLRQVGNMSWTDTGIIRKVISKSKGEQAFEAYWPKFKEGATNNGFTENEANRIWNAMKVFGRYAFNKCISGNTIVVNARPNQYTKKEYTVAELYESHGYTGKAWRTRTDQKDKISLWSVCADGKLRPGRIKTISYEGKMPVYEIISESGAKIRATGNHRFLSDKGWREVDSFSIGDLIAINMGYQQKDLRNGVGKGWRKGRKGGAGDFKDRRYAEVENFKQIRRGTACDGCGKMFDRIETHHITRQAPNSKLIWLCSSCHKKEEYRQGRTKVWEKGFAVGYEHIISISLTGEEDVFDIEMENVNRPSFVANDFVSHNSHSTAYAMLGFWSMYFKQHYPLAYYTAKLMHEEKDENKRRILKEMTKKGYKIHPPKLGKSGVTWKMEEDGVRGGFSEIDGIGKKTSAILASLSEGDIKQIEAKKIKGVNKKVIQALKDTHALDDSEEDDFYKMNIFDCLDSIAPDRTKTIDIDDGGEGYSIVVAGIFREMNYKDIHEERRSRGQALVTKDPEIAKYAMIMLEDDTDRVLIMVDRYVFHEWGQKVWDAFHNGSYVVIRGKKTPKWRIVRANDFSFFSKEEIDGILNGITMKIVGDKIEKESNGKQYTVFSAEWGERKIKIAIESKQCPHVNIGDHIKVFGKEASEKNGFIANKIVKEG